MAPEHDALARQLADTRWVTALARRLCADAATADDVAQDTWLSALQARRTVAGRPRTWFRRVAQNCARQRARADARRGARERSVARPEAEADPDLVARAETSTRLVAHVLALDEPYRRVILARYFDGLTPEDIAARTGANPSTVRTRLERGLALLRARLERDGGTSWLAALAPLALGPLPPGSLVPVAPLAPLSPSPPLLGLAPSAAALPSLVVPMALLSKLTLAAAALGAGLYFAWPDRAPERDAPLARAETQLEERAPRTPPALDAPTATRTDAAAPPAGAPQAGPDGASSAAPPLDLDAERKAATPPGTIEGLVVRWSVPLDGGHVDFLPGFHERLPTARAERLARVTDGGLTRVEIGRDGRFALAGLAAGWYSVGVDTTATRNLPRGAHVGAGAQFDVKVFDDRDGQRLVIELGGARIIGHVYDDEGRPVAGAVVGLSRSGSYGARLGTSFAETDEAGSYEFHDLLSVVYGIHLESVPGKDDVDYAFLQLAPLGRDETRVHDIGARWPAVTWRGRVVHSDGAPVERGGTLGRRDLGSGRYEETDLPSLGAFTLRLRPGRYALHARVNTSDSGFRTEYLDLGEVEVPGADFERDLALPAATVRGRVTGASPEELPARLDLSLYPAGSEQADQHAGVGRDGTFVLYAVAPGEYRVDLWPEWTAGPTAAVTVREGDGVLAIEVPVTRR